MPVPSYVYLESYINDDTNPKENRHFSDLLYVDTKSIVTTIQFENESKAMFKLSLLRVDFSKSLL